MSHLPKVVSFSISSDPDPLCKWFSRVSLFKIDAICSFKMSSRHNNSKSCIAIYKDHVDGFAGFMGSMTLNSKKMCSNCCMRILIGTTSFDYFKMNNNLQINIFYIILKHPQILFHFTRRKHKHLFNKIMNILAEYGWYNFPQGSIMEQHVININYAVPKLTASSYPTIVEKVRGKFWLMLELCHSRKYLLRFIKVDHGKYFHEIFMREIQRKSEEGDLNNVMHAISYLIVVKHGQYFRKKIEKSPSKLCYIYLNRFMKLFPDKYIDINKAKTKVG